MDEVMRYLQGCDEKAELERFRVLSMRVGVARPCESQAGCKPVDCMRGFLKTEKAGTTVAKVIEFYIPDKFRKSVRWISPEQRGKIIEFPSPVRKSA